MMIKQSKFNALESTFEKHYRVRELADFFGISQSVINRAIYSGELKAVRFGKVVLIPESAIKAHLTPAI